MPRDVDVAVAAPACLFEEKARRAPFLDRSRAVPRARAVRRLLVRRA